GAREVLLPEDAADGDGAERAVAVPGLPADALRTARPARDFRPERAAELLAARLGVASLEGFGLEGLDAAVGAAGALVAYLERNWPAALAHLRPPRAVRGAEVVYLDPQTRRNLELFEPGRSGAGSLVATLGRTLT